MNALSDSRRNEVLDSAKRSFCYRRAVHAKLPFSKAVQLCPKYQTLPDIVSEIIITIIIFFARLSRLRNYEKRGVASLP